MRIAIEHDSEGNITSVGVPEPGAMTRTTLRARASHEVVDIEAPSGHETHDGLQKVKALFRVDRSSDVARLVPKD